jgi:glycine cleavage system regulatory protein
MAAKACSVGNEVAACEKVNEVADDSASDLSHASETYVKFMVVRIPGTAHIRPGMVEGTLTVSGSEGFDIIPEVTRYLKDHHASIAVGFKTFLHADTPEIDVHGAHYVFIAPEADFQRINAEISAAPIWKVCKPRPKPITRNRTAKAQINVPNGEGIVWRISQAMEARDIFIRTMACSTFTPKRVDEVPACWRRPDGSVGEVGTIDMKLEMSDETVSEIDSLVNELWQVGDCRWDIQIEERTPNVSEPFYVERTPVDDKSSVSGVEVDSVRVTQSNAV